MCPACLDDSVYLIGFYLPQAILECDGGGASSVLLNKFGLELLEFSPVAGDRYILILNASTLCWF